MSTLTKVLGQVKCIEEKEDSSAGPQCEERRCNRRLVAAISPSHERLNLGETSRNSKLSQANPSTESASRTIADMRLAMSVSGAAKPARAAASTTRTSSVSGASRKRSKMESAVSRTPVMTLTSVVPARRATSSGNNVGHFSGKSEREMSDRPSESCCRQIAILANF